MNDLIEYKSDTSGLWSRFITKLIAATFFTIYASSFFSSLINSSLSPLIVLLFFVILILSILKEYPPKWKNRVTIDFQKELIIVNNKKNQSKTSSVLDFDGEQYSFDQIDSYSTINYESFLFDAYYMVKISVQEKEIKLLAFKEANEFTRFIGILKNQLKLKVNNQGIFKTFVSQIKQLFK